MAELLRSFTETHTPGLSDLIIRNGSSDPTAPEYQNYSIAVPDVIRYIGDDEPYRGSITGNAGYCPAQQEMWERYPGYAAYLTLEDDTVLHTKGFDRNLLATFDFFPGRVGYVQLYDRAQTIEVQCFSAEWCNALGHLCNPEVGETAFILSRLLAGEKMMMYAGERAEFTHYPLLKEYGYTGDERPGALSMPEQVAKFRKQEAEMLVWMRDNGNLLRAKLEVAAHDNEEARRLGNPPVSPL
jgi:hypothetical protein